MQRLKSIRNYLPALVLLISACAHAGISDRCASGARERRPGETVVRQRHDATRLFVFVQGLIGTDTATTDFFWPEKVATDDLFQAHDVFVLALGQERATGCMPKRDSVAAIAELLGDRLGRYRNVVMVTHDIRHVIAIDEALSRLKPEKRQRVQRVFLFNTPAADDILRSLPESCQGTASARLDTTEPVKRTVCSTFDERRLADEPVAAAVCDTVLLARMSADMKAAPPCADALYEIFRVGLADSAYEAEHHLPRFGGNPQ